MAPIKNLNLVQVAANKPTPTYRSPQIPFWQMILWPRAYQSITIIIMFVLLVFLLLQSISYISDG